ncbi:MAG: PucR family transcriptional regulator ligand-binding domain-containing protein [Ruminococcus sp.]
MAFCLESLLSAYQKCYHLCIVAGENGVCNPVTWVYLAEDIENIPMLKDNQLVITTGLFTKNGTTLMEFLSAIIAQNEAGIILNIGKYLKIEDITEEVRNFCTAHHFPFYTMPWEVPLTDVMQSFCAELLKHSQTHSLISTAFRNTLMHLENPEKEEAVLEQNGFKREDVYTIIAISGSFSDHGIDRLLHHKKMNFLDLFQYMI